MLEFGQRTNRVWDQRRALTWLDRFEVPLGRRCGRLSGGQRAQVAIAVALGSCPGLLMLDEPLANLDPVARSEVTGELLAEVADSGMTVILSTDIVAELAGVGEHLLLLAAGRSVLCGDIEELLARHIRLTGPRADLPPSPGTIVQAQHTGRQSTFIVKLPGTPVPPAVAPGWTSAPLTLEELTLAYLKTPAKPHPARRPPYEHPDSHRRSGLRGEHRPQPRGARLIDLVWLAWRQHRAAIIAGLTLAGAVIGAILTSPHV